MVVHSKAQQPMPNPKSSVFSYEFSFCEMRCNPKHLSLSKILQSCTLRHTPWNLPWRDVFLRWSTSDWADCEGQSWFQSLCGSLTLRSKWAQNSVIKKLAKTKSSLRWPSGSFRIILFEAGTNAVSICLSNAQHHKRLQPLASWTWKHEASSDSQTCGIPVAPRGFFELAATRKSREQLPNTQ
jgi:hypothetical protein